MAFMNSELIVDLFAGGGGASLGIEQALCRHVDIAINHDAQAIAIHRVNHPQTLHYQCDIFEVDPREATQGKPVGLLWLSPDCTHHSKAKGGKPVKANRRAFLIKYYGTGEGQEIDEALHTVTTKDRIGLVYVQGQPYQIVDIQMRMLAPRELARAQGFPDSYILEKDLEGKALSKAAQVRLIGNSVCPDMAKALVKANFVINEKTKSTELTLLEGK